MSFPGLVDLNRSADDTFHDYFSEYSVYFKDVKIPSHIAVYEPDNHETNCISVITPEPSLGAKRWTINGQWITIGIFRDMGRKGGYKPVHDNISWVRHGDNLIVYDTKKHQLILGEEVKHAMTNVSMKTSTVTQIIDDYAFITKTEDGGSDVGNSEDNGSYYVGTRFVDFEEDQVVFRLLPSFMLVTWSFVKSLFTASTPEVTSKHRSLYEVTSGATIKVANQITPYVNYSTEHNMVSDVYPPLQRRFNQLYDEEGKPLQMKYDGFGLPIVPDMVDSKFKNNPPKLNNTLDYAINGFSFNPRVMVYDFYGLEINNPERGPYQRIDLITRDKSVKGYINNIKRKSDVWGTTYYTGGLYDEFGNIVIGIQKNNAVVTKKNILPLTLDQFNHPVKASIRRNSNGS